MRPRQVHTRVLTLVLTWSACDCSGGTAQLPGQDAGQGLPEGRACTTDAQCASGQCPSLPDEARACRDPCAADGTCPTGYACTTLGTQRLCLPTLEERPVGSGCQASRQCQSGQCVSLDQSAQGVCVAPCPASGSCPQGTRCVVETLLSATPHCLPPLDDRSVGEDCVSGRECLDGRCMWWGRRHQCAPPCTAGCGDGGVCVDQGTNGVACMGLLPPGQACAQETECLSSACYGTNTDGVCVGGCGPDRQCPPDLGCAGLQGLPGLYCVPLQDNRAAGESCTSELQCQSGRCARFGYGSFDAGTLCADPCDGGACPTPMACWGRSPDAGQRGLCGPAVP
jgi:hypothetical protein